MTTTFNIGLARNDGRPDNSIAVVVSQLLARGLLEGVKQIRIADSETERTLVLQAEIFPSHFEIHRLAGALAQDCIAVRNDATGRGFLVGPNAAKWGEFNPDYFLEA